MYIFTSLPLVHDDRTNSLSLLFSSLALSPSHVAALSFSSRAALLSPPASGRREGDEEGRLPPSLSLSFRTRHPLSGGRENRWGTLSSRE